MHTGGLLATGITMAVTYAAGWCAELAGVLSYAWAHVTPGQAATVIGLLTYVTHNGPRFGKGVATIFRRFRPRRS